MATAKQLAALLAALLVAAHVAAAAAAFRTTVTTFETTESDKSENFISQECRQEMMGTNLDHCMRHLEEEARRRRSYGGDAESGRRDFDECCRELERMRSGRCRCEGLEAKMDEQMGRGGRAEMRGAMRRAAEGLPNKCGLGPSMCSFDSSWY